MRICHHLFFAAIAVSASAFASEPTSQKPLKCDAGPVSKSFGNGPWLVYACDDEKSVVVVSGPGNPASPFYFMFSPNSGGYRLVGEGAGSKTESGVALAELQRLTTSEIVALGAEARLLQSKPKR